MDPQKNLELLCLQTKHAYLQFYAGGTRLELILFHECGTSRTDDVFFGFVVLELEKYCSTLGSKSGENILVIMTKNGFFYYCNIPKTDTFDSLEIAYVKGVG